MGETGSQMHSFLRVDVDSRAARPFSVTPFLVRRSGGEWRTNRLEALSCGGRSRLRVGLLICVSGLFGCVFCLSLCIKYF